MQTRINQCVSTHLNRCVSARLIQRESAHLNHSVSTHLNQPISAHLIQHVSARNKSMPQAPCSCNRYSWPSSPQTAALCSYTTAGHLAVKSQERKKVKVDTHAEINRYARTHTHNHRGDSFRASLWDIAETGNTCHLSLNIFKIPPNNPITSSPWKSAWQEKNQVKKNNILGPWTNITHW